MSTETAAVRQLTRALEGTQSDFAKMPFFVRPLVRRNFLQTTGLDVHSWLELSMDLDHALGGGATLASLAEEKRDLPRRLHALLRFYVESPAAAAKGVGRFSPILEKVKRDAADRERAVRAVLGLLEDG